MDGGSFSSLKMLRKLLVNFFNKEIPRVSSHHSKVLPQFQHGQKDCSVFHHKNNEEYKKKSSYDSTVLKNLQQWKLFYERYQKSFNDESKSNPRLKEEFLVWCSGVLAISSVIVGHKWFQKRISREEEEQQCTLRGIPLEILHLISNPLQRSNVVLAVKPPKNTTMKTTPAVKNDNKEDSKAKLENIFELYKDTTDECNGTLLNKLAISYSRSNNHKQAFTLFKEASKLGNDCAMFNLGLSYENGVGTNKSYQKAGEWYKQAGESGHGKALFNLGSLCYKGLLESNESPNGFSFIQKAADIGIAEAQLFVGLWHAKDKHWKLAFKYFERGANQKDASCMYNLGICYDNGYGVSKDTRKALSLYGESSRKGHVLSQFLIGESYQNGNRGLSKDLHKALEWFKKAEESGHPKASTQIEYLEYELAQKNEDALLTLFESNALLNVLRPMQSVLRKTSLTSSNFHKSSSMPSLQKVFMGNPIHTLLNAESAELSRSTASLYR